jgi:hypothetical protein
MTVGLGKAMSEAKRKPRAAVLKAVGATPRNTFTNFAKKFAVASGPLKGRKLMDPVPLHQVKPALTKALRLKTSTPYPIMLKRAYGK